MILHGNLQTRDQFLKPEMSLPISEVGPKKLKIMKQECCLPHHSDQTKPSRKIQ